VFDDEEAVQQCECCRRHSEEVVGSPTPVETKTGAVPADDSVGLHCGKDVGPAGPKLWQSGLEEPVRPIQTGPGPGPLENHDLLSERKNFKGRIAATAEEDPHSSPDSLGGFEHGVAVVTRRNLTLGTGFA
jgi:hypothetical protein